MKKIRMFLGIYICVVVALLCGTETKAAQELTINTPVQISTQESRYQFTIENLSAAVRTYNAFLSNERKKGAELFLNKDSDLKDLFTVDIPEDVPMKGILKCTAIGNRLIGVASVLLNKVGRVIGDKAQGLIDGAKNLFNGSIME